jgi:hypothetical protein
LGYTTEIIAGGTNLSGFNVLAYTSTNGLVIPANLLIGEDQAPAPRNLRHVEIRGTATIGNPFTDDTIFGANYASVTDQLTFTNSIATWSSNAVTMGMPIAFSTNTAAAITRTNFGLGLSALTNTNTTNFRTAIGLGAGSTNEVGFGNVKISSSGINFIEPVNQDIVIGLSGNEESVYLNPIYWNDGGVRTALGLGLSVLTNTNVSNFRTAIGLGVTNDVTFGSVTASSIKELSTGTRVLDLENFALTFGTNYVLEWSATEAQFNKPLTFFGTNVASTTRTNLGLGWSALTNTNTAGLNTSLYGSGTNPVLYNTNGEVVSPTNFWQVAPISTTVQYQTNITATSTNAATNSRNLFLFSLAPTVSGVTNTVTLPTNPATTFEGDRATIVHLATNTINAITAVRQLGAATNLITLNQGNEAVLFMYRSGVWGLADNVSYVEPIFFSGTNAAGHVAESRTNLGIPLAALTNTNAAGFQQAIFSTNSVPTNTATPNTVNFTTAIAWMEVSVITNGATNSYRIPLFR